jgi:hypothetical protein
VGRNTRRKSAQTWEFPQARSAGGTFYASGNWGRAFSPTDHRGRETPMHVNVIMIQPLIALLFGILILMLPRLLNYLIAIYLIFIGLVGLFPHLFTTAT